MKQTTEKELFALETSYWQAMKDKDMEAAIALTDDPCIVAGAQGVSTIDRAAFKKMMSSSPHELRGFELKNQQVRILSEDFAVLAYDVLQETTKDGKDISIEASESSTWVRRNGKWLCTMHTESLREDPAKSKSEKAQ